MVEGHVSSSTPESLANGSIATNRVSQARQIKRVVNTWREMLIEKGTLIQIPLKPEVARMPELVHDHAPISMTRVV